MGKGFTNNNPLDKLAGNKTEKLPKVSEEKTIAAVVSKEQTKEPEPKVSDLPKKETTTTRKKPGRPKTKEPSQNINVSIPIRLMEQLKEKRGKYGLNMTQYIISLIEYDLNN